MNDSDFRFSKKLIGNAVLEQFGKLLILVAGQAFEMGQGKAMINDPLDSKSLILHPLII